MQKGNHLLDLLHGHDPDDRISPAAAWRLESCVSFDRWRWLVLRRVMPNQRQSVQRRRRRWQWRWWFWFRWALNDHFTVHCTKGTHHHGTHDRYRITEAGRLLPSPPRTGPLFAKDCACVVMVAPAAVVLLMASVPCDGAALIAPSLGWDHSFKLAPVAGSTTVVVRSSGECFWEY